MKRRGSDLPPGGESYLSKLPPIEERASYLISVSLASWLSLPPMFSIAK